MWHKATIGRLRLVFTLLGALCISTSSLGQGRLLGTGGVTQVEGSAGGGLAPWAVISGYGTNQEISLTAAYTHLQLDDYQFAMASTSVSFYNRVELSYARQNLDLSTLNRTLGLPSGTELEQNIYGLKVRLFGDIVYSNAPQVSVGLQYKKNREFLVPGAVGATRDEDYDVYLSATKLFIDGPFHRNLLVNATMRSSRANHFGLLGFGGDRKSKRSALFEGSLALLLNRKIAIGIEYRQKPDNIGFAREDDARDLFVAYFPNRNLSVTLAYVDLGNIALFDDQRGWYLSVEGSF